MKEYIITKFYSDSWGKKMPATLIYYDEKDEPILDLHIQTGSRHNEVANIVKSFFATRFGLIVNETDEYIGSSGVYYSVPVDSHNQIEKVIEKTQEKFDQFTWPDQERVL